MIQINFNRFIFLLLLFITIKGLSQSIPSGVSWDQISTSAGTFDTWFYKPQSYDSTSSILWFFHGMGGNGASASDLKEIADRRKTLIVSVSDLGIFPKVDTVNITNYDKKLDPHWLPYIMKEIYDSVLSMEQRDTMWIYMTGFSAGGQHTTRFAAVYQGTLDSLPIKRMMPVAPGSYVFVGGLESLTPFLQGLTYDESAFGCNGLCFDMNFLCDEHIERFYSDNYVLLCGTEDVRLQKAQLFYSVHKKDAQKRGVPFNWLMDTVSGVGHSLRLMYNTKLNEDDTVTIAEKLLFDSPYYSVEPVEQRAPVADFFIANENTDRDDDTLPRTGCAPLDRYFEISCSPEYNEYFWDFGDGTTSTESSQHHTYTETGAYTVKLKVTNSLGVDSVVKENYIHVSEEVDFPSYYFWSAQSVVDLEDPRVGLGFKTKDYNEYDCQWHLGDGTVVDTICKRNSYIIYTYDSVGTYDVKLVLENACGQKDSVIEEGFFTVVGEVGIQKGSEDQLSIQPNPVQDNLNINLPSSTDFELFNIGGECVLTRKGLSGQHNLDVSALPKGLYLVKIVGSGYSVVRKIVKQ